MTELDQIAEEYYDLRNELQPLLGIIMGVSGGPTVALQDLTVDGEAEQRQALTDLLSRTQAIPEADLDQTEATTRAILMTLINEHLQTIDSRTLEMALDAFAGGQQSLLLVALPRTQLRTGQDAEDLVDRLACIPKLLADSVDRLRSGRETGRTVTQIGAAGAIAQTRGLLDATDEHHPFLLPFAAAAAAGLDVADALARATAVLHEQVNPALQTYLAAIETDLLPTARDDEHVGLCHLPDGADIYNGLLATHTTTALTAEEIHQIGLEVIAGLVAEYADLGEKVFGTRALPEIFSRLRTDEALRYDTGEQAASHAQECVDRAAAVVSDWIGCLPTRPCVVTAMPEASAKGMTVALYGPPQGPDAPHGTYWINTHGPVITRYEAECVAFHEAVPGHHTQIALQTELDLPRFRQEGLVINGFAEGWGLYTERLADEMGLYSGDLARLGMLAMDSLRACRLVVDTGVHHLGWSRQQALAYVLANAPVSEAFALAEVNRYCVYPGQACGYMIGRHEIVRLRSFAEETLGAAFDIRAFHDVVLGQGQVPLRVLADNVERWAASQR